MKKIFPLILLLILSLMFSMVCRADIAVQPLELSITMVNEFIHGNTSKKITITNNNDYNTNISWYLEHPDPISWIRSNKTCIPSLSWVDLDPKWCIVQPDDSVSFYIYLDVPESEDHLEQHWETWVTFKEKYPEGVSMQEEHAVRVYIDTPSEVTNNNHGQNESSMSREVHINIPLLAIAISVVFAVILLVLGVLTFKKKKS